MKEANRTPPVWLGTTNTERGDPESRSLTIDDALVRNQSIEEREGDRFRDKIIERISEDSEEARSEELCFRDSNVAPNAGVCLWE